MDSRIPREQVGGATSRRVAMTVVGTLLVAALLNAGCFWLLRRFPLNRGYWLIETKWRLAGTLDRPVDWLIIGDSSGNQGVVPDRLGAALGGRAVNLSGAGGVQVPGDLWILNRYLERHGPPPNVVIVHAYDVWRRDLNILSVGRIPWRWGFWDRTPALPKFTLGEKLRLCYARFLPLYFENQTIYRFFKRGLRNPASLLRRTYHVDDLGYMKWTKPYAEQVIADMNRHLSRLGNIDQVISGINLIALKEIAALAAEHRIEVYLAYGPQYEGLHDHVVFTDYLARQRAFLAEFAAGYDHVHYLDNVSTFPAEQMENVDHVTHEAAERYTDDLIAKIREAH